MLVYGDDWNVFDYQYLKLRFSRSHVVVLHDFGFSLFSCFPFRLACIRRFAPHVWYVCKIG